MSDKHDVQVAELTVDGGKVDGPSSIASNDEVHLPPRDLEVQSHARAAVEHVVLRRQRT